MDWQLDSNFNLAIDAVGGTTYTPAGAAQAAQRVAVKLKHFTGEIITNLNQGVNYHRDLLGKVADDQTIDVVIRNAIKDDSEVLEVTRIDIERDSKSRGVTIRPYIRYVTGETAAVQFTVGSPTSNTASIWINGQPVTLDSPFLFVDGGYVLVDDESPLSD